MTTIKCSPKNHPMRHPMNDYDRFFQNFFGGQAHAQSQSCGEEGCNWSPRADISEGDQDYEILVELPGVGKGGIELKVEDGVLILRGERKALESEARKQRRVERVHGRFERRFRLPKEVDADKIDASFADGLLVIRIAKSERVAGRQIEVR
jgi:HSP20 family protein